MIVVQANNLAILTILADRPDGRIAFAELEQQLQAYAQDSRTLSSIEDQILDRADLIEAGLAITDGHSLQITLAGRSAINEFDARHDHSTGRPPADVSNSLTVIDDLIGVEQRSKIFNLGLREETETGVDPEQAVRPEQINADHVRAGREIDHDSIDLVEPISRDLISSDFISSGLDERGAAAPEVAAPPPRPPSTTPAFLARRSGESEPTGGFVLTRRLRQLGALWRQHLEQDLPNARAVGRSPNLNGAIIALVSLLIVVVCAGAAIAVTQIRALQTEISSLQRELIPLKVQLLRLDQVEKAKEAEKTREERSRQAAEKTAAQQVPLTLSREEAQLIRDYIKPAPVTGTSIAPVSIGDPLTGPMIPFPLPITEKVPKLLGARFAIRNGTILIVKRESHQVDAILGPN